MFDSEVFEKYLLFKIKFGCMLVFDYNEDIFCMFICELGLFVDFDFLLL